MPLSFTDAQLKAIETSATPLDRFIRSAFLNAVGVYFRDRDSVGDGELGRCLRELQREFLNPPRSGRGPRDHYGGSFNRP
jgi:hypothetical protein